MSKNFNTPFIDFPEGVSEDDFQEMKEALMKIGVNVLDKSVKGNTYTLSKAPTEDQLINLFQKFSSDVKVIIYDPE